MVKERRRGNYKKDGMKMKWFDVIASGSLLGMDYKRASSYPVGYVDYLKMYGIDFEVKTGFGSNEVKVDRETDWSTDVVLENASDSSQYMKTTMTQGSPMALFRMNGTKTASKIVGKTKYYGEWSKVKKIRIKK